MKAKHSEYFNNRVICKQAEFREKRGEKDEIHQNRTQINQIK